MKIEVVGPISEKNALFDMTVGSLTEVTIDLSKMTFVNSIGVKNWMTWLYKVPTSSRVYLYHCPLVMVNQASTVAGFLSEYAFIMSFSAPYLCEKCGAEKYITLERGKDFEYALKGAPSWFKAEVEIPCHKCSAALEPDYIVAKTFSFLNRSETRS